MAADPATGVRSAGVAVPSRSWRWAGASCLLICLVGLGVSGYLTAEHAAGGLLACPSNATFDCQAVTTDPKWSVIFGVPVAVYGLIFFVAMLALCVPPVWRATAPQLPWLRAGLTGVGTLMVFYLIGVELFAVDKICVWCTGVHALTIVLFLVLIAADPRPPLRAALSRPGR